MNTQTREKSPTQAEEYAHLTLEEMGPLGDTLAHYEGGRINVSGGIPGEQVVGRVFRYRRRGKAGEQISAMVTANSKAHTAASRIPRFFCCTVPSQN